MAGCANCLSTTAPNQENMDSLFDTIVSKHVDGVTSRSISSHIPSKFHVLLAYLAYKKEKDKSLENVSCNTVEFKRPHDAQVKTGQTLIAIMKISTHQAPTPLCFHQNLTPSFVCKECLTALWQFQWHLSRISL